MNERYITKFLEIVHLHIFSLIKTISLRGTKYFVNFVDDYLKKFWIYILRYNRKYFEKFEEFKAFM